MQTQKNQLCRLQIKPKQCVCVCAECVVEWKSADLLLPTVYISVAYALSIFTSS